MHNFPPQKKSFQKSALQERQRSLRACSIAAPQKHLSRIATSLNNAMPVPISVTGFATTAGSQEVHAEVAETASASDWFSKMRGGESDDVDKKEEVAATPPPTMDVDEDDARVPSTATRDENGQVWGISVNDLDFSYPGIDGAPIPGSEPLIKGMNLHLRPGSCCLLLGANGAGKTTLLKIMGGKHMVPRGKVLILGREAFYDTSLTSSGDLSYIGGNWQRDVAFAGYNIPLAGDFPASKMLDGIKGVNPARKKRIIEALDVDMEWRMHQVSDGQRRRVQLAWGLMHEFKVLLLDEITVDLDVLGRAELMKFLRQECEERQCTILYATHIFDGLEKFASHVAFVAGGKLQFCKEMESMPALKSRKPGALLKEVEIWLREDARLRPKQKKTARKSLDQARNNGWGEGRLGSTLAKGEELRNGISQLKNASNAVMRC